MSLQHSARQQLPDPSVCTDIYTHTGEMSPTSTLQLRTGWSFLIAQSQTQQAKRKLVGKHTTNTWQQYIHTSELPLVGPAPLGTSKNCTKSIS